MGLFTKKACLADVWAGPDINGKRSWYPLCRCGWKGRRTMDRAAAQRKAASDARTVRR